MGSVIYNGEYAQRVRLAAIGCGGHAFRNIFPTFAYAPVDLVAVCDLDRARADNVARLFGARAVYADYRDMLGRERPEAVVVVTNYDEAGRPRYPAIAQDVLRAGAHAWIEKPPAASVVEIEAMQRAERETGRFVAVGLKKMFFPANVKAREIIARPDFGPVSTITARYPQSLPPQEERADDRKMVGFLDHVAHPYSVLRLLGGPLESLLVERAPDGGSVTSLRFVSGAVGSLHLPARPATLAPLERTEVVGCGASVVVDNNVRVTYYRPGSGPEGGYGRADTFFGPDESAPLVWEPEFSLGQLYNKALFLLGYAPEIRHFCDCVLENRPPERGNLDDAHEILRVYEAYRRPDGERVAIAAPGANPPC